MSTPLSSPAAGGDDLAAEADAVAAAVLACPGVAALHPGRLQSVTTFLPGRRVEGVRLQEDRVQVSVVLTWGMPLVALTDRIRAAVEPLAGGRPIDVLVADVRLPDEEQPALPTGPGAPELAGRG